MLRGCRNAVAASEISVSRDVGGEDRRQALA
jgi:hypothetical protein